jgi:hypothetical protein
MRILALDPATHTGWATNAFGKEVLSGVEDFSLQRGDSNGMRFIYFRRWLSSIASDKDLKPEPTIDLIIYEIPYHRGGRDADVLLGLISHLKAFCAEIGIEYTPVPPSTLKKSATGSGRASKQDMVEAAKKRWNKPDITDDNEADALMLLSYALEKYGHAK